VKSEGAVLAPSDFTYLLRGPLNRFLIYSRL
jgi:hypothetical protein